MSTRDKVELFLILLLPGAVWFVAPSLPSSIAMANLVLGLSGLILLQSLVRDVSILMTHRKAEIDPPQRAVRCMCVESTVGATGVLVGLILVGIGIPGTLEIGRLGWTLGFFAATLVDFGMKDLVFQWSPFKLYREKDHLNLIFTWKKPDP